MFGPLMEDSMTDVIEGVKILDCWALHVNLHILMALQKESDV